jgi:hypothetical protein
MTLSANYVRLSERCCENWFFSVPTLILLPHGYVVSMPLDFLGADDKSREERGG